MRIWGKLWHENHLLKDTVVEDLSDETRTHKVFHALEQICNEFDLGQPIWLDANIADFQKRARTKFRAECFIEDVDFDYLEIQVLEE